MGQADNSLQKHDIQKFIHYSDKGKENKSHEISSEFFH